MTPKLLLTQNLAAGPPVVARPQVIDIEELIEGLTEMEVNVDSKNGDNIRVFCA